MNLFGPVYPVVLDATNMHQNTPLAMFAPYVPISCTLLYTTMAMYITVSPISPAWP